MMWVIARTSRKRPTLMHRVGVDSRRTLCGVDIAGWSKAWFDKPIPQVECLRCKFYSD